MNNYDLKEKVHHGTIDFPIEVYHATGLMASYHWHEECEFIYITSGRACIRIGVNSFELKEGDCAYVSPNALHSISTENHQNLGFYAIVFHPSLIFSEIDICNKYLSSKYTINNCYFQSAESSYIIHEIKQLCETYEKKLFAYELKIKAYLYTIFNHIFECGLFHIEENAENKKTIDKLETVIKYIHNNCNSNITVEQLAKVSGYSISHFTRFFKELTGKSPIEYVNRQRIYHACNMLNKTNLSVLEISFACGFEHVGHFINIFKKHTGYTPQKYRKYEIN